MFKTYPVNTTYMINSLIAQIEGLPAAVDGWARELADTKADFAEQEKLMAAPFAKQGELDQKRRRHKEIMDILTPKEEQTVDSIDEDKVQYQARKAERPERRRALHKGEMLNEFRDALTDEEWYSYYKRIMNGKYNPDLFEDNDVATISVGNKFLLLKMMPN